MFVCTYKNDDCVEGGKLGLKLLSSFILSLDLILRHLQILFHECFH